MACPTLLRSATENTGERRSASPYRFHPGVVVLSAFEAEKSISVVCLNLLETQQLVLHSPGIVVWDEGDTLRVHCQRPTSGLREGLSRADGVERTAETQSFV